MRGAKPAHLKFEHTRRLPHLLTGRMSTADRSSEAGSEGSTVSELPPSTAPAPLKSGSERGRSRADSSEPFDDREGSAGSTLGGLPGEEASMLETSMLEASTLGPLPGDRDGLQILQAAARSRTSWHLIRAPRASAGSSAAAATGPQPAFCRAGVVVARRSGSDSDPRRSPGWP